jgi:Short C-terminal domain
MFRAGRQAEEFARVKAIVEARIFSAHSGHARHISAADEVKKFAVLRERGIITEEEFQQKQRTLLGLPG